MKKSFRRVFYQSCLVSFSISCLPLTESIGNRHAVRKTPDFCQFLMGSVHKYIPNRVGIDDIEVEIESDHSGSRLRIYRGDVSLQRQLSAGLLKRRGSRLVLADWCCTSQSCLHGLW